MMVGDLAKIGDHNTVRIARVPGIQALHTGHSIISHAVFVGLERAVREMKELMRV